MKKPPFDENELKKFLGISENNLTAQQKEVITALTEVLTGGVGRIGNTIILETVEENKESTSFSAPAQSSTL